MALFSQSIFIESKLMRSLLIILFFTSISGAFPSAHAQTQVSSVSGKITDNAGEPLPGITILIENTSKGTTTNLDGRFSLKRISPGKIVLVFSGVGYAKQKRALELEKFQNLKLDIEMQEDVLQIDEITLLGRNDATKLRESAKAVSVVETKKIKLQTANLGEVLTRVSGVNVRNGGGLGAENRFSLNGLTDDQIRFMIDGIPLDLMGYTAGIANVPLNLIDRVDIYKGVVPVALGADALGGAVNLITPKDSLKDGGSFSYQTGSFGTHRLALNGESALNDSGLFFRGSAYYDYAKNNYKVDVEVPDEQGKLQEVSLRRFHDAYKASGVRGTIGLQNKNWAEELSLEVFTNQYEKEIQNNNVMSIVYGEIMAEEENYGALARYRHQINEKLKLNISGGYTHKQVKFIDTSKYIYTWYGDRVRDNNGEIRESTPGELDRATNLLTSDHNTYGRFIFNYKINENQNISLSSAPTYVSRELDERYIAEGQTTQPANIERSVFTWVNGLEHNWKFADNKIENNLFVKDYIQNVKATEDTDGLPLNRDRESHNFGFGNSLKYQPTKRWLLKASYEWAARLPRPNEVFGNGRLVVPNLGLKPERSHNANLELNYSSLPGSGSNWKLGVNGFLRSTDNLILLLGNNEVFSYQNVFSAVSTGIEANVFWESANNRLDAEANFTWQDFRNQSKEGEFNRYKGDRIPNRPYLFANGKVNYRFPKIFEQKDELNLFLGAHYVNEFFRGWGSVGLQEFKDKIPAQFTQNLGVTYQLPIHILESSLTAEVQNLTDEKVYDFFGVQRPGRAFYIKLTTQF